MKITYHINDPTNHIYTNVSSIFFSKFNDTKKLIIKTFKIGC